MGTILLLIIVPLGVGLLTNELTDWLPKWAEKIVCWTARKLPDHVWEKYEQIWLADLEDCPTGFSKLWFAFCLNFGIQELTAQQEVLEDSTFDLLPEFQKKLKSYRKQKGFENRFGVIGRYFAILTEIYELKRLTWNFRYKRASAILLQYIVVDFTARNRTVEEFRAVLIEQQTRLNSNK